MMVIRYIEMRTGPLWKKETKRFVFWEDAERMQQEIFRMERELQRYRMKFDGYQSGEKSDNSGEWIRYADFEKAISKAITVSDEFASIENKKLREALDALSKRLEVYEPSPVPPALEVAANRLDKVSTYYRGIAGSMHDLQDVVNWLRKVAKGGKK